jgi:cytochrome c oxidase cbb3-type subunit III
MRRRRRPRRPEGAEEVDADRGAAGASGAVRGRPGPSDGEEAGVEHIRRAHQPTPSVAARGKAIWDPNCAKCHAPDMRGAAGGINLVRNQMVMDDQNGELIGKFLQSPHAKGQASKMDLAADQVHDLAIYMHTFMNYRTIVMPPDINGAILAVGNAKAGEAYFNGSVGKCSTCHSVTGDLKGLGSKYPEPRTLQNTIVSGGGGGGRGGGGRGGGGAAAGDTPSRRTVTVTVTPPKARSMKAAWFHGTTSWSPWSDADGTQRTIRRNGDDPKVEVHDPMKFHRDLLLILTDEDIHNLTAYLVTVK